MLNSSDYAKNYASTIGKSLTERDRRKKMYKGSANADRKKVL